MQYMSYLDNAATTRPKFRRSYYYCWLNSNMPYAITEQKHLDMARDIIKNCLHVKSGKVLFFRCATEAIEWLCNRIGEVYCSKKEHDSVYKHMIPNSNVWAEQFVNQMTGETIKYFPLHLHNNDIIISDFTATIGHVEIPSNIEELFDAVWFSGHKFHTEKGIGAMWISDRLATILSASEDPHNQYGLVHGTVDVEGACMIADAMREACKNIETKEMQWHMLSDIILKDLKEAGIECNYVADDKLRTHAINALYLKNINADALAVWLHTHSVYVGVGHSACADNNDYRVLNYYGLSDDEASSVIRVSFDEDTTIHDIKELTEYIIEFNKMFKEEE